MPITTIIPASEVELRETSFKFKLWLQNERYCPLLNLKCGDRCQNINVSIHNDNKKEEVDDPFVQDIFTHPKASSYEE